MNYIPIVLQDIEEPTMVVRPSVPPAPPAPKTPKYALKQRSITGKTVRFAAPLTQVRTYQRANGTRVRSHTRVIKSNKSSKFAKASKPRRITKNVASRENTFQWEKNCLTCKKIASTVTEQKRAQRARAFPTP